MFFFFFFFFFLCGDIGVGVDVWVRSFRGIGKMHLIFENIFVANGVLGCPGGTKFGGNGIAVLSGDGEGVDAVNDCGGDREFRPASAGDAFDSGERQEVVAALEVAGGGEGNGAGGAGRFGVAGRGFIVYFAV